MKLYGYFRSSAAFRVRIGLNLKGLAYETAPIHLRRNDQSRSDFRSINPQGLVPALQDRGLTLIQSMAILEYLAERFPEKDLWPADSIPRALARSVAAEMHAGFQALRQECPMNFWRPVKRRELSADARTSAARIVAMWAECLERYGGPFLFGAFGAADGMYAPVVSRFHTYAVEVGARSRAYMDAVMALPAWREWKEAALKEPWVLPEDEPDWPTVLRVDD